MADGSTDARCFDVCVLPRGGAWGACAAAAAAAANAHTATANAALSHGRLAVSRCNASHSASPGLTNESPSLLLSALPLLLPSSPPPPRSLACPRRLPVIAVPCLHTFVLLHPHTKQHDTAVLPWSSLGRRHLLRSCLPPTTTDNCPTNRQPMLNHTIQRRQPTPRPLASVRCACCMPPAAFAYAQSAACVSPIRCLPVACVVCLLLYLGTCSRLATLSLSFPRLKPARCPRAPPTLFATPL